MKRERLMYCAFILALVLAASFSPSRASGGEGIPAIESFIGAGPGERNPKAPAELEQFGRLAGVWDVEVEMQSQDGRWMKSAPGVWAWKYALDGFAVRDLWYRWRSEYSPDGGKTWNAVMRMHARRCGEPR